MRREPGMLRAASRNARACALLTGAALSALVALHAPAQAQATVFVGKGNPTDVILNLSVLNKLGPPPKIVRSMTGSPVPAKQLSAERGPILLTPPEEKIGEKQEKAPPKASAESAQHPAPAKSQAPKLAAAVPSAGPPPPPVIPEPVPPAPKSAQPAAGPVKSVAPVESSLGGPRPLAATEAPAPPAPSAEKSSTPPAAPLPAAKPAVAPPAPAAVAVAVPSVAVPTPSPRPPAPAAPAQLAEATPAAEPPTPPVLPASKIATAPAAPAARAAPAAPVSRAASAPSPSPPLAAAKPAPSKPAPPAPETQLASKPPAAALASVAPGVDLSIPFTASAADLSSTAKEELGKLADRLKKNQELRLQLVAYAAGSEAEASQARRLSLSRALAVRGYLFDQGVGASRMDVRALGNKLEGGGSADRVDLVVVGK